MSSKVLGLFMFYRDGCAEIKNPPCLLASYSLGDVNFLFRGSAADGVRFIARVVAERIKIGEFTITTGEFGGKEFIVASFIDKESGLVPAVVAVKEYKPANVLFQLMRNALGKFKATNWYTKNKATLGSINKDAPVSEASSDFSGMVKTYQTPEKIDKISKIQKEIEETTEIMMKNLDAVLRRGERLEDLLAATNEISEASKGFARRSEQLNDKCCTIL